MCLVCISIAFNAFPQSKATKKYLDEQEAKYKEANPPLLKDTFPIGSLGEKLQQLYEQQGSGPCQIIRTNRRIYIPSEILDGYGLPLLRSTKIYDLPFSADNLLFLTLLPSEVIQIQNGSFNSNTYVSGNRIVGINERLTDFGKSTLVPIDGFPSLVYQKSCGSYFKGNTSSQLKVPIAEMSSSLEVEAKKSSLITTISGKFFSPLTQTLKQNNPQSIYAHMLLWEIYLFYYNNSSRMGEQLFDQGKYISEFNGTLINSSINTSQSYEMNARLSAGYSAGIISADGRLQTAYNNQTLFSLKGFNTSIHKQENGTLSFAVSNLPRYNDINDKLQNSINFEKQPPLPEMVSHLMPLEITKVMLGIPQSLCSSDSWKIESNGYDNSIWQGQPSVVSTAESSLDGLPKCKCKITGYLKQTAVTGATDNQSLPINLELTNAAAIGELKLKLKINESVRSLTSGPRILQVSSEVVNNGRQEIKSGNTFVYNFDINAIITGNGMQLSDPLIVSNPQIELVNANQNSESLEFANEPMVTGNSVKVSIRTGTKTTDLVASGEMSIPIRIKFNVQLRGGKNVSLVSNTINLSIPNLIKHEPVKTQMQ